MGSQIDSDLYPTTTYQDPLLYPLYVKTNDHTTIAVQVHDDWLLSAYIADLNQEIVDDIKEFKDHKELINEILWNTRTFGWCGVQFYNTEPKVFSSLEWTAWITEVNTDTNKNERVGMKTSWADDLGNTWEDELYFDDRVNENKQIVGKCYLFIWQKGNGRVLPNHPHLSSFALADVSNSILGLSIQARQIVGTLTYGATNPFFFHLKYGDSITPTQRTELINQMSYVYASKAIGAKKGTLDSIEAIENGSVQKAVEGLDKLLAFFASSTRLPLSYYLGEKQTGGLGDTGDKSDNVKVYRKKEFILQHFLPGLEEIYKDQWNETLPDLYNYYTDMAEANALAEEQAELTKIEKGNKSNEKTIERTNQE